MIRIANVVGARPQFIKARAIITAIDDWNRQHRGHIEPVLIHTGQHYDTCFFDVFYGSSSFPNSRLDTRWVPGEGEIYRSRSIVLQNIQPSI